MRHSAAEPLTIVLVLRRRPRPRKVLCAGGVPVVQMVQPAQVLVGAFTAEEGSGVSRDFFCHSLDR
jgi:hypothetical protein